MTVNFPNMVKFLIFHDIKCFFNFLKLSPLIHIFTLVTIYTDIHDKASNRICGPPCIFNAVICLLVVVFT